MVKPSKKIQNEKDLHCYMVSDQAQALEINDIFDKNQDSRKTMKIRVAGKKEVIPKMIF